ncbi:hypothetical protein Tco_1533001 [Tanacetum coccineum]
MEHGIFFNQSKYIKEMLKKLGLKDSKPTKTPMYTKIKLKKDDEADFVDSTKYQGTKMPSEYQQDYKKTRAYAPKIYNDPNMSEQLRDIYRTLENRYVHEGRTIDPSFYSDLSDDFVAKFTNIGICLYSYAWGLDELDKTLEQVTPYHSQIPSIDDIRNLIHRHTIHEKVDKEGKTIHKFLNQIETNELLGHLRPWELVIMENVYSAIRNRDHTQAIIALMLYCVEIGNLKANMSKHPFDECYVLVPRKMASLKAKQPKNPPSRRTRNVGKSKCAQLTTLSSSDSPPSDNGDLPSTKLSPRSYGRALPFHENMSEEQRETRGMFKNLARALHKFAKMLKKGCR